MVRERDDAVRTYIKYVESPVIPNPFVLEQYWSEVNRQCYALLGIERGREFAQLLYADPVKMALYKKSEQSRVDLIIWLQRTGRL